MKILNTAQSFVRRQLPVFLLLAASVVIAACSYRTSIRDISELKPEEIMIVGKVVLDPALKEGEQTIAMISTDESNDWENAFGAFTTTAWEPVSPPTSFRYDLNNAGIGEQMAIATGSTEPSSPFYGSGAFRGFFGEYFFAPMNAETFFVRRINMIKEQTNGTPGWGPTRIGATDGTYIWAILPGGLELKVNAGDRALYVGTIRMHRDKNFDVRKVEIIDEYNDALKAFNERFKGGGGIQLQKRLFKMVKGYKVQY